VVETTQQVAEEIFEFERRGATWQNGQIRSVRHDLDKARREGYRRVDFDADLDGWGVGTTRDLVRSGHGKWHLCEKGESKCGQFTAGGSPSRLEQINLADAYAELDLCYSAESRIGNLIDRLAHTSTAKRHYEDDTGPSYLAQ
jgi:hypothetical protein